MFRTFMLRCCLYWYGIKFYLLDSPGILPVDPILTVPLVKGGEVRFYLQRETHLDILWRFGRSRRVSSLHYTMQARFDETVDISARKFNTLKFSVRESWLQPYSDQEIARLLTPLFLKHISSEMRRTRASS